MPPKVKIVHAADFHLTPAYSSLIGDIERRKEDLRRNVRAIFEETVKRKADLLLLSGDLFERVTPASSDFVFLSRLIGEVTRRGVTVVAIAGNHDKPRKRDVYNPLVALAEARLPRFHYVQFAEESKPILVECASGARVAVVALPYVDAKVVREVVKVDYSSFIRRRVRSLLSEAESLDADYKVLVAHVTLMEVADIAPTSDDAVVGREDLCSSSFDYVALGHIHRPILLEENMAYSGSPERLTFREIGDKRKGFIYVELTDRGACAEIVGLPCRSMLKLSLSLTSPREVLKLIRRKLAELGGRAKLKDALLLLDLRVTPAVYDELYQRLSELRDVLLSEIGVLAYKTRIELTSQEESERTLRDVREVLSDLKGELLKVVREEAEALGVEADIVELMLQALDEAWAELQRVI